MWLVREKCASSEERHVFWCWGRLEGRSETNPPVTAVCQLQRPVGRQNLCFQPLVEEAPGNLPQVVYPLSQGGSHQLGEGRSRDLPRPSLTASLPGAAAHARVWAVAGSSAPLGTPESGQDTGSLGVRPK